MKKAKLLAFVIIASILASTLLISTTQHVYVRADTVFQDNFETGDFSTWTGTMESNGTMEIVLSPVLEGDYSAMSSLNGWWNSFAFAYYTFDAEPVLYHREYIRVSDLPPVNTETDLFGIMDHYPPTAHLGTIAIDNDGTNYRW